MKTYILQKDIVMPWMKISAGTVSETDGDVYCFLADEDPDIKLRSFRLKKEGIEKYPDFFKEKEFKPTITKKDDSNQFKWESEDHKERVKSLFDQICHDFIMSDIPTYTDVDMEMCFNAARTQARVFGSMWDTEGISTNVFSSFKDYRKTLKK